MQEKQTVFHIRSTRTRNPHIVKPNTVVWKDVVHRRTVRQLRAFPERENAFVDFIEQRLTRIADVERVEANDKTVRVFVGSVEGIKASKLKRIKACMYLIPVVSDKINSWCKTLSGMVLSGDNEQYQSTEEVTLVDYLKGRAMIFIGKDGKEKTFSF